MADITINGKPKLNAWGYQVVEDSTPVDPSSSSGGFGQIILTVPDYPNSLFDMGTMVTLSDLALGETEGTIATLSTDETVLTVTANSLLGLLSVTATALPYSGTLGGYFTYLLHLVGITTGFQVDSSITGRAVTLSGWNGNIWDQVKALCAAQQVEVTLASDSIVMRPLRQNLAQTYRDESRTLTLDTSNIAQTVSSFYYQGTQQNAGMAFPLGGLATNPTVLQVDAKQTIVSTIPLTPSSSADGTGLGASLTSVSQPIAQDNVPLGYSGAVSVYQVLDQNNNLYPAAKWLANGGKVTAAISPDGQSLTVTVIGCNDVTLGPYRLGIPDPTVTNSAHSSLFIMGTGVFYNKQLIASPTGNANAQTANQAGPTIDNFAVTNASEARSAALWAAVSAQGPTMTLAVDALGINRAGDQQNFAQMTMGQFDALFAAGTFGAFDGQFPAETFGQFDVWAANQVAGEFANQAFGNVAGARVIYKNNWYRIDAATITPDGISYTAIGDTTFGDLDAVWAGATFAQFDAIWAGRTFGQFPLAPLTNS